MYSGKMSSISSVDVGQIENLDAVDGRADSLGLDVVLGGIPDAKKTNLIALTILAGDHGDPLEFFRADRPRQKLNVARGEAEQLRQDGEVGAPRDARVTWLDGDPHDAGCLRVAQRHEEGTRRLTKGSRGHQEENQRCRGDASENHARPGDASRLELSPCFDLAAACYCGLDRSAR